jgi:hypothetical protein
VLRGSIRPGHFADAASLQHAFADAASLQHRAAIQSAREAGAKRILAPGEFRGDRREAGQVERPGGQPPAMTYRI